MPVPNIFGSATSAIPLSQLDQNFATAITLGNTAVYLGNTTTSLGNVTLTNVTISSGNVSVSTATVGAGSNTAPSITTTGDTNTGIFFPAADTIAFSEGGVESMRIDASGNMGLGVTPSANSLAGSGYRNLEIGSVNGYGLFAGSYEIYMLGNAYYNSGWKYANSSKLASRYIQTDGIHAWFNAPSGTAGNTISFTQAMTLDASGNLLVGRTNTTVSNNIGTIIAPTFTSIAGNSNGTLYLRNCSPTVSADIGGLIRFDAVYRNSDSDTTDIAGIAGLRESATNANYAGYLAFSTTPNGGSRTERARIDSSGNLLVGTTTSTGRVAVQVAANGDPGVYFRNASGTNVGQIQVQSASTVYVTSSDYRLKENVTPMTGALAAVAALKPCTYTWKESGEASQGFIAHELAEVCPDAVIGEKDGEEMQGVDYGKLTPILTAALQEAIAKIETLEARIAALEEK